MQEPFEEEENFLKLDETFNPEDYENAWVEMMIPITATISYTTKPSMTTEEAWQQWYCMPQRRFRTPKNPKVQPAYVIASC